MGDDSQDSNTLGTLKCGIVNCTSLKIGDTEFPANAASNSNQQILPADPKKGNMLFWNGSKWGLVKSESGSDGALLTLINGVPVWKSYNIQADQTMSDLTTGTNPTGISLSQPQTQIQAQAIQTQGSLPNSTPGLISGGVVAIHAAFVASNTELLAAQERLRSAGVALRVDNQSEIVAGFVLPVGLSQVSLQSKVDILWAAFLQAQVKAQESAARDERANLDLIK